MSNFASSKSVILKNVTLDFFDVFSPGKPMNDKGEPKYKVKVIIEPNSEAHQAARAGMTEAAINLWGDNAKTVVPAITNNSKALRDGNSNLDQNGAIRPEYKDKFFVSASNVTKPQCVAQRKHEGKFITINQDGSASIDGMRVDPPYPITVPYRGCKVNVKVQFVAGKSFKTKSGEQLPNQIYAKFEALQFVADGTPFGAGPTSAEGFEDEEAPAGAEVGASGGDLF